jgi:hypothetical protein
MQHRGKGGSAYRAPVGKVGTARLAVRQVSSILCRIPPIIFQGSIRIFIFAAARHGFTNPTILFQAMPIPALRAFFLLNRPLSSTSALFSLKCLGMIPD